jgi:hypothetical protein
MVDLPLIVHRDPAVSWFADTEALNEGRLWADRAAAGRSDGERMSRELRDNLFGRELWPRLEPATRAFLASAEAVFRAHRDDPGFDLSGSAVSYAKAVETELNALLFPALKRVLAKKPQHEREIREDGRLIDLGGVVGHQTLGSLKHLLEHQDLVRAAIPAAMPHDHRWVLGLLPRELNSIVAIRNAGAHSRITSARELEDVRRSVLGIGAQRLIEQLVRVRLRCA